MDIGTINNFVSSIGFPIVAFLLMYKNNRDMQEMHKEEVDNLAKVIEANTDAMKRLVEKLQ